MVQDQYDPIGHSLKDYLGGKVKGRFEVIERRDGTCYPSLGPELYFRSFEAWDESERLAIQNVKGPALDIGCGAGRHSLYLQDQGIAVTAIDPSRLAIEVCRERGVSDACVSSIEAFTPDHKYNSMLLFGNNMGLARRLSKLPGFLTRLNRYLETGGLLVGDSPNVDREMEIRIWYKTYVSQWMEWLFVSAETLAAEVAQAGFEIADIHQSRKSAIFAYVLKKIAEPATP